MKYIEITHGKRAVVDDEDFDYLNTFKWRAVKDKENYYVGRSVNGRTQFMHRLILNTPNGMVTDHINGDGLDNRKSNIRICSLSENARNRRVNKVKGVHWNASCQKWRAQICLGGKNKHLGLFETIVEAQKAYDVAAKTNYKEFARTNFSKLI